MNYIRHSIGVCSGHLVWPLPVFNQSMIGEKGKCILRLRKQTIIGFLHITTTTGGISKHGTKELPVHSTAAEALLCKGHHTV